MTHHNQPQGRELYFNTSAPEIRMSEGGQETVYGYAALYGVRSRELTTPRGLKFVEEIMPGAFDDADFSMVRCQFDHRQYIAAPPVLKYGLDSRGLWYEVSIDPDDPDHKAMARRVRRGEAKGSSFIFTVQIDNVDVVKEGGVTVHRVRKADAVLDVGPVVAPAYPQTSAFVRAMDAEMLTKYSGSGAEEAEIKTEEAEIKTEASEIKAEAVGNDAEVRGIAEETSDIEAETAAAAASAQQMQKHRALRAYLAARAHFSP